MKRLLPAIQIISLLILCSPLGIAQEETSASVAISYQDIGPKFHIDGRFGTLFQECKVKAIVVSPPDKRDRSEDDKTVWLEIKLVDGKAFHSNFRSEKVYTNEKFTIGAEVELMLYENAELVSGDSISLILSNPNRPKPHVKMVCRLSLHHRRTLSNIPPKK